MHIDYLYQHFLNAALILLNESVPPTSLAGPPPMARFPVDPGNPYAMGRPDSMNQTGFATFGAPHVLGLIFQRNGIGMPPGAGTYLLL